MKVLERMVQDIGDWEALDEVDRRHNEIESKYGFPTKRRYQMMTGPETLDTLIIEREWESLAAMETAFERLQMDEEYQALGSIREGVVLSMRWELYFVL